MKWPVEKGAFCQAWPGLISEATWWKEPTDSCKLFSDLYMQMGAHMHTHTLP